MAFLSSYQGRRTEHREDLPEPAVPVKKIDFTEINFVLNHGEMKVSLDERSEAGRDTSNRK